MFLIKIFLLFFILLIGFSRMYLGAHSLDQIIFGWNNENVGGCSIEGEEAPRERGGGG